MKHTKKTAKKKKKVLDSYKQVGSKFIAPMNQFNMSPVSFYRRALPELIWWDVIADQVSLRFSITLSEAIGSFFKERKPSLPIWGAFISEYKGLTEEIFDDLKTHLDNEGLLKPTQDALDNFFRLYPKCPLIPLLDAPPSQGIDIAYLGRFEKRLEELEYKRSKAAVMMQSHAIYTGFVTGKLKVFKGIRLGNLNELKDYPNTEESKAVGGSVCAAINAFTHNLTPEFKKGTWAVYFWERSYEFRPLKWDHFSL